MKAIVIGSGPTGIAAVHALVARGASVTVIDGGEKVRPDDKGLAERLAGTAPDEWSNEDRRSWQSPQFSPPSGQVRRYGSDAGMRTPDATFTAGEFLPGLRSSHAAGGLSNLWGAAVARWSEDDIADWPLRPGQLSPHYDALESFLPFSTPGRDLPETRQLRSLLSRAHRLPGARLQPAGLAVAPGCRACGMCLHGCPWHLIWSAEQALSKLAGHDRVTYLPGPPAIRFSETAAAATVTLADGRKLAADRLFVAAGVLETARLVFASSSDPQPLSLAESRFAFLPMLEKWVTMPRQPASGLPTLPLAFLKLTATQVSPFEIHAQIYGWNEFYAADLKRNYGRFLPGSGPVWNALSKRLIVAQTYIHSDHCDRISLAPAADGRLTAALEPSPSMSAVMGRATTEVGRNGRRLGLLPLRFAARTSGPGEGFHAGGSLPMSASPKARQTDLAGRPHGLARVHVVDASVLPTIPASTITLPAMANAHRIASLPDLA